MRKEKAQQRLFSPAARLIFLTIFSLKEVIRSHKLSPKQCRRCLSETFLVLSIYGCDTVIKIIGGTKKKCIWLI